MNQLVIDSVPSTMKRKAQLLVSLHKLTQTCHGKMMVQLNFMANLFQGLILLIWSMMSLDIIEAVNLQVWQAFAEGLRDMNILQDVIGNGERWDWIHRAPETPETDYITPKQKRTIRKTAIRIPVSVSFRVNYIWI